MRAILLILTICIFNAPAFTSTCEKVHKAYYLQYNPDISHPAYKVRYKVLQTKETPDPYVMIMMAGRGTCLEMYEDWFTIMLEQAAQDPQIAKKGIVIYLMNFPGQSVVDKEALERHERKNWKDFAKRIKKRFNRTFRGSISSYDEYVLAAHAMFTHVYNIHQKPVTLMGHSMGGHVALRYALQQMDATWLRSLDHRKKVKRVSRKVPVLGKLSKTFGEHKPVQSDLINGVYIVSPMMGVPTRGFPEWAARLLAKVAVAVGFGQGYVPGSNDYDPNRDVLARCRLTTCEDGHARLKELALTYGTPNVTFQWLKATFESLDLIKKQGLKNFNIPLNCTMAENEKVVLNSATKKIVSQVPTAIMNMLPGMHTPFSEKMPIQKELSNRVINFLKSRVTQFASSKPLTLKKH